MRSPAQSSVYWVWLVATYCMIHPIRTITEAHGDLPFCIEGKQSWVSVGMLCLISLTYMGVGFGFLYWSWTTLRRRVFFCEQGFWTASGEKIKIFKWSETPSIQQVMTKEHLPIHLIGFLLPAKPSRKIIVGQNNGTTCTFSKNNIREFTALEEILHREATQRQIPWVIVQ